MRCKGQFGVPGMPLEWGRQAGEAPESRIGEVSVYAFAIRYSQIPLGF